MADWKPALDRLIVRTEIGAWRHGLKTDDAIAEVISYGKFPADLASMWPLKWREKNGDAMRFMLYYYVQSGLKNRRRLFVGKSGTVYRLRSVHNVKHGAADGECDDNGEPVPPEKKGLWLRREDLNAVDVEQVQAIYRGRATDSSGDKRWLAAAAEALSRRPSEATCADVADEIEQAM
jgi:hypothetical protein